MLGRQRFYSAQKLVVDGVYFELVVREKLGKRYLYNAETDGTQYVKADGKSVGKYENKADITLYPHWQVNEYTVILDYSGESGAVKQVTAAYGTEISGLPTGVTAPHKVFKGWYTAPNCGGVRIADEYGVIPVVSEVNETNFAIDGANNRIYLYAGFETAKYRVTLDFGGVASSETLSVEYDTPVKDLWQAKIVFDVNGGDEIDDISKTAGADVSLPKANRDGYIFAGWYKADSSAYTSNKMPSEGIKLTAKYYKAVKKTYTLITASKTEGNTLDDATVPNTSKLTNKINVADIYEAGIREVKITANYTVSYIWNGDYFHVCPNTATAYMNYYSESIASDAYLMWSYGDIINKNDTSKKQKTHSTTLTLSSSMIYVCKYVSHNSTFGSGCTAKWTDF